MKSINEKFFFRPAKNGQHVSVHNLILMVYTPEKAAQFGLTKVYAPYVENFRTEDECHKQNLRFADTSIIAELDTKQDKLQAYLVKSTSAAREVPIEATASAANRVYYAMGPYLEAAGKEYNINATEVRKLVALLKQEPLAADVATLGMTAVVDVLVKVNTEFTKVYLQRKADLSARQMAEKMVTIRPKVDDGAKLNFLMINSRYNVAYLDGDAEQMAAIGELIDAINGILAQFQRVIGTTPEGDSDSDIDLPDTGGDSGSTDGGEAGGSEGSGSDTDSGSGSEGSGSEHSGSDSGDGGGTTPPPTDDEDDGGSLVG